MTLVVAAVRAELGELPGHAVGVGPIRAAVGATALIARHRPDAVVLIGSCGAYRADHAIGQAYAAVLVGTGDAAAASGLAYVPLPAPPLLGDPDLLARLEVPQARVLTLAAITRDPALSGPLAADWDLEHMEAFGVAHACAQAGVPFVAVLGVANRVGPDAHAEWTQNRGMAEHAARVAVAPLTGRS